MTFGEQLKDLRKKHGLTQGDLAKAIGRRRLIVNLWETDKSKPSATSLKLLTQYFKVDVLALVEAQKPKRFLKGQKAQNAYGVLNGLMHLIWGMKEAATDPIMKDSLKELEEKIRQIMAERFEK